MDKVQEIISFADKCSGDDIYLILGDVEYEALKSLKDQLKITMSLKKAGRMLIGRVNQSSFMDTGRPEMFFLEEHIRLGVRSKSGKFYRIVDDESLVETKKPRQPKWFKDLINGK